ncbi:MAG: hypothetical protein HY805_09730 [Nitrospirae bacterium]|nr:hypothetical protein [Nitrospirota bacterium]
MSPTVGVIIMVNNHLHDVSTAMLLACGVAVWLMIKRYEAGSGSVVAGYFMSIYKGMAKVARFSLYWILIGAIPRTLTFRSFEWSNAVIHNQIPALILKHILAFTVVSLGVWLWLKINQKMKVIKQGINA